MYEHERLHVSGTRNSPTCGIYALQQAVEDNAQESPQTAQLITRIFYMDDFVQSGPSAEQTIETYKSLRAKLAKGGFQLTKWISNCEKTLTVIDPADKSPSSSKTFETESTSRSIL